VLVEGVAVGTPSYGDSTIPLYYLSAFPRPGVPLLTESRNAVKNVLKQVKNRYPHRRFPDDVDMIELPDNSSWHYFVYLDALLGLEPGGGEKMLRKGETHPITGKMPVCPGGGLSSSGEAVAAQGILQIHSCVQQLRGEAGEGQIKKEVKVALAQTYGYAGNSACALLSRGW
jgi:acetyl-CoA acetyltransferase